MVAKLLRAFSITVLATGMLTNSAYSQDASPAAGEDEILAIQWEDLMSQADLDAIMNAPAVSHDSFGWEDSLTNDPEAAAYQKALQSFDVNPDLIDKEIIIPGFIVPTAYNDDKRVTEFFLVPFFGACIHVPPPPPNQIIHVKYAEGVQLDNYYEAYFVQGTLSSQVVRSDLANSAYSLYAEDVTIYEY